MWARLKELINIFAKMKEEKKKKRKLDKKKKLYFL